MRNQRFSVNQDGIFFQKISILKLILGDKAYLLWSRDPSAGLY